MAWFVSVVSADVTHAGVDQGVTNMAGHIVSCVNSVGVVVGKCFFVPGPVHVVSLALGLFCLLNLHFTCR